MPWGGMEKGQHGILVAGVHAVAPLLVVSVLVPLLALLPVVFLFFVSLTTFIYLSKLGVTVFWVFDQ